MENGLFFAKKLCLRSLSRPRFNCNLFYIFSSSPMQEQSSISGSQSRPCARHGPGPHLLSTGCQPIRYRSPGESSECRLSQHSRCSCQRSRSIAGCAVHWLRATQEKLPHELPQPQDSDQSDVCWSDNRLPSVSRADGHHSHVYPACCNTCLLPVLSTPFLPQVQSPDRTRCLREQ